MVALLTSLRSTFYGLLASTGLYALFIGLLTIPVLQDQVIYLNRVTLTWFQDVNIPEQWGFLRNQVSPFFLKTPDGESLHAWHILPLGLYQQHQTALTDEPHGLASDIKERISFKLLRDDPSSLLVLYFHGAAGTLGSGWRPPSYRAMSAGAPYRIHTLAIDYRGFGASSGSPSEEGLLTDAITLAEWAMKEAGIPPSRIVIFAQSLGTAVSLSLIHHMATRPEPVLFSGVVLVAPFADVESLTATYRIAGTIPLLDPVARFPRLLCWLNTFIKTKWPSKSKLADFIRRCEDMDQGFSGYDITMIHAEDDYNIPWSHSEQLFWHAVNASMPRGITFEDLEEEKIASRVNNNAGGWAVERRTSRGVIREEIMKYGLHDRIMSYPVVSLAVMRAFHTLR
ncbi:Alpha/Beta hydrolase protein [Xylaria bambusicola]|uniref:Alpha/Beta hydrolase protein n=1 Tax=Xylaria bambusicola TaxID=326684 RepID=UPI0020085044|nr:Alpha/Beta hydrolase protein [Xylaria bambusicola]KAI0518472.1 Alpha/Beta hydrolase protein [Xylaria bambusicola]